MDGYGVYAAAAPHRTGALRLVNAADFSARAAAPGSLISVQGGRVDSASAGSLSFPVLAASDSESQIQVPFEASTANLSLALQTGAGRFTLGLPVQAVSPAIFVNHDGSPMILDGDSGLMLDGRNTAHSDARIEILATGLGKVRPDWPTGMAAPLENPPVVAATVKAYLDRVPVPVTRAALAPGYIGFYLIEVQLPAIVNAGPAELYITADGQESNRVQVVLDPKFKRAPAHGALAPKMNLGQSRSMLTFSACSPWVPASPRTLPPRLRPGNGNRLPGWPKSVRTRRRRCFALDETIAFGGVKPFHDAFFSHYFFS